MKELTTMGKRTGIGLPNGSYRRQKQKTVSGVKYEVRAKSYYGTLAGWNIYKDGEFIRFHNGKGLDNPFDPKEMINWSINNL